MGYMYIDFKPALSANTENLYCSGRNTQRQLISKIPKPPLFDMARMKLGRANHEACESLK